MTTRQKLPPVVVSLDRAYRAARKAGDHSMAADLLPAFSRHLQRLVRDDGWRLWARRGNRLADHEELPVDALVALRIIDWETGEARLDDTPLYALRAKPQPEPVNTPTRNFPASRMPELVDFLRGLEIMTRPEQKKAARQHFREFKLTEDLFRQAFQQLPRGPGRKPKS